MTHSRLRYALLAAALLASPCAPRLLADSGVPAPAAQPSIPLEPIVGSPPPAPPGAYNYSKTEVKPTPLDQAKPHYPPDLRKAGIEGKAYVDFLILPDGTCDHVVAFRATDRRFAEAAVAAVRQWKFKPGMVGGQPVVTRIEIPLIFNLNDDNPTAPNGPERHGPVTAMVPPNTPGVYDISKVEQPPVATYQGRPYYPRDLRAHGVEGSATVTFIVGTDGLVHSPVVTQGTDAAFADAAMAAVAQWKFRPAQVGGKPVNCQLSVPITFSLHNN